MKLRLFAFFMLCSTYAVQAAQLQITELEDIDLGSVVPGAQNVRAQIRFCVNSTPTGPFQITGYGSGPGGTFEMVHPNTNHTIAYDVYVQRIFGLFRRQLQPGIPNTILFARPPLPNGQCSPPFLRLLVDIDERTLESAPGGAYQSILQLTVGPE